MKYPSKKSRIYIGFSIVIILLGCLVFESYKSILRNRFNDNWVIRTHQVMESNERLASYLTDAESNQLAYIITGRKDFLALYQKNKLDFSKEKYLLKSLTINNRSQQINIDSIGHLGKRRLNILDNSIVIRDTQGLQALTNTPTLIIGKKTMDTIRQLSGQINSAEQLLLTKRELLSYNNTVSSQWLFFISVIITVVLLSFVFTMLSRQYALKKKAEKELYNSNEWYAQTLKSLGDGVIGTSPDHHITYMNKAAEELTLYKSSEALLLPVESIFNIKKEITGSKATVPTHQAIMEKRVVEMEDHTILVRKDNSEIYIDDSAAPVYDMNGNLLGAVLIFRDITEKTFADKHLKEINEELEETVKLRTFKLEEEIQIRKKAEEEKSKLIENLVQTNKSLEQFIYIISHNFRRPVANILGLLNLIEKSDNEASQETELNFLTAEVNHLDRVLTDLGTITSVLKNQTEHKEIVAVNEVLNVIMESLEYELTKADAEIITHIKSSDTIFCIKSYFNSIVLNLISNAIKYKDPQRRLKVSIRCKSDYAHDILIIKDNGLGIDMDKNSDKIFGLYNRFHAHIEGKGLGLHISKTQMEMMGGKIIVKSKPGHGAAFMLYFPKYISA